MSDLSIKKNLIFFAKFVGNIISRFLRSTTVILFFAFVFICLSFGTPIYFTKLFGAYDGRTIPSIIFVVLFSFLVYFILPAIVSKLFLREKLQDLGLQFPENKIKTYIYTFLALSLLLPFIILLTRQPSFQKYYALSHNSTDNFILLNIILYPIYYFSEEFFYRGFLFLGIWQRLRWHSFWITDIIFALAHLGKPGYEILLSMFASIVFNCLTLSTKSIFPAMIVHWIMGTTLIIIINMQ